MSVPKYRRTLFFYESQKNKVLNCGTDFKNLTNKYNRFL